MARRIQVDVDGDEEATAGIALQVLGVEIRPYVFFRGTGDLMGHVWSGTASEYTPALQGNFLLMDHMQLQPLLSGLIVQLQLKGALSADLGGSVQISLWNRYPLLRFVHTFGNFKGTVGLLVMGPITTISLNNKLLKLNFTGYWCDALFSTLPLGCRKLS